MRAILEKHEHFGALNGHLDKSYEVRIVIFVEFGQGRYFSKQVWRHALALVVGIIGKFQRQNFAGCIVHDSVHNAVCTARNEMRSILFQLFDVGESCGVIRFLRMVHYY